MFRFVVVFSRAVSLFTNDKRKRVSDDECSEVGFILFVILLDLSVNP